MKFPDSPKPSWISPKKNVATKGAPGPRVNPWWTSTTTKQEEGWVPKPYFEEQVMNYCPHNDIAMDLIVSSCLRPLLFHNPYKGGRIRYLRMDYWTNWRIKWLCEGDLLVLHEGHRWNIKARLHQRKCSFNLRYIQFV